MCKPSITTWTLVRPRLLCGSVDASGNYTISGLSTGSYKLQFRDCGFGSGSHISEYYDDKLDPKATGKKTPQADFDRNRDGLYGGLPKARDASAPGPAPKQPRPSR